MSDEDFILSILPEGYLYKLLKVNANANFQLENPNFEIELRVNIAQEEAVKAFLEELYISLNCHFNILAGKRDRINCESTKARYGIRGFRKCSMNVFQCPEKQRLQPGKNTDCESCITFRVENPLSKNPEKKIEQQMFPLWMIIKFRHNHSLDCADFYRYQKVSQCTKDAYTEFFKFFQFFQILSAGILPF